MKIHNETTRKILKSKLFWTIFFLAVIFSLSQMGRFSLWQDEAWVANCILEPTIKETIFCETHIPLAPPLFTITVKETVFLFGNNEFIFRLVPAILGFCAIIIIYLLSYRFTKNKFTSILTTILFTFNPLVMRYMQELKPYIGDVFFTLLLIYLTEEFLSENKTKIILKKTKSIMVGALFIVAGCIFNPFVIEQLLSPDKQINNPWHYLVIALLDLTLIIIGLVILKKEEYNKQFLLLFSASIVSIWFSHVTFFIIPTIILRIVVEKLKAKKSVQKKEFKLLLFPLIVILINFFANYFIFIKSLTTDKYLLIFWEDYFVYSYNLLEIIGFILKKSYSLFSYIFPYFENYNYLVVIITIFLFIMGLLVLVKRKQHYLLIYFLTPFVLVILASIMQKYLYGGVRTNLFLIPLIIISISIAITVLYDIVKKYYSKILVIAIIMILLLVVFTMKDFTKIKNLEELKPVILFYKENKLSEDHTYLYYGSYHAFQYYHGISEEDYIILGTNNRNQSSKYIQELNESINNLSNGRFWLVFSHHYGTIDEIGLMVNYTSSRCKLISHFEATDASTYLFSCNH